MGRQKAFREEMRHFQPLVMPESMPDLMEQGQGACTKIYEYLSHAITRPASLKVSSPPVDPLGLNVCTVHCQAVEEQWSHGYNT